MLIFLIMDYNIKSYVSLEDKPHSKIEVYNVEDRSETENELQRLQTEFFRTGKKSIYDKIVSLCTSYTHSMIKKRFTGNHFEEDEVIWYKAETIANIFCRQYITLDMVVQGSFAGMIQPKILEVLYGKQFTGPRTISDTMVSANGEFNILENSKYAETDVLYGDSFDFRLQDAIQQICEDLADSKIDEYQYICSLKLMKIMMLGRCTSAQISGNFKHAMARNGIDLQVLNRVELELNNKMKQLLV